MAHNFVKQSDGSKMCSKCGDEIGVSIERDCPRPVAPGNLFFLYYYIFLLSLVYTSIFYLGGGGPAAVAAATVGTNLLSSSYFQIMI